MSKAIDRDGKHERGPDRLEGLMPLEDLARALLQSLVEGRLRFHDRAREPQTIYRVRVGWRRLRIRGLRTRARLDALAIGHAP